MKLPKPLPPPTKADRRLLAASVLILLGSVVIAVLAINSRMAPPQTSFISDINGNPIEQPQGTLMAGIAGADDVIKQLTAMPNAPALTGALADEVNAVSQMVSNCADYSQTRRDQMNQHIAWLLQPSTLPKDVIIALGTNINGRLIFGMSTFTLAEWGQHAKASDSCLLHIGKKLNEMLVTTGEASIPQFDVAAG